MLMGEHRKLVLAYKGIGATFAYCLSCCPGFNLLGYFPTIFQPFLLVVHQLPTTYPLSSVNHKCHFHWFFLYRVLTTLISTLDTLETRTFCFP